MQSFVLDDLTEEDVVVKGKEELMSHVFQQNGGERTLMPTADQMRLLVRNVTRGAEPLSESELTELRTMRERIGLARWERWLELARETRRISSKPRQQSVDSDDSLSGPPKLHMTALKKTGGEEYLLSGAPLSETEPSLVDAASFGRSAFESELASARSQLASAQHAAVKNAKESRVALLELREALEARELELATARRETDAARAERDALLDRLAHRSQRSPATLRSDSVKANAMVGDGIRTCLRRLDAARGAALLAAALAADARQAPDALAAAEEHLRAFAACAVDFAATLATALGVVLPEHDPAPTPGAAASPRYHCDGPSIGSHGFRDALGDHLRARARAGRDVEQDDARVSGSPASHRPHAASSKYLDDDGFDQTFRRGIKVWKAPCDSRNNRAWR